MLAGAMFLLSYIVAQGQQPAYYEHLASYEAALDLLEKEKYGAAQEKFKDFISKTKPSSIEKHDNDIRSEAEFYHALCAYHLLRNNASSLMKDFADDHRGHPKENEAWYYMGKLHYIKKQYQEAVPALEKLKMADLERSKAMDANYMLGWAYYNSGDLNKATPIFYELKNQKGPRQERSAYYYAMIQYQRGNYKEAMGAMESLKESKADFKNDIPVLYANCLLKLKKYGELETFATEIESWMANPPADFYRLLANANFEQNKFPKASQYFEEFLQKRGNMTREDNYRYGYSEFIRTNYKVAIERFEKVLYPKDELAQNASYFLGHCFLEINNSENARTAFRKASEMEFDKTRSAEALYQYALVSFSTKYFEDALLGFQKLIKNYPESQYAGESKGLIGEILLYSGKYEEAIEFFEKSPLKTDRTRKAYQTAAYSYAVDLFDKGLYQKSASYFRVAVNHPFDRNITLSSYFWLAEGEFREGRYEDAVRQFDAYLEQRHVHKHSLYNRAYYGLGWAKYKQGEHSAALRDFEKFLALSDATESPEIMVDAYLRSGDCEFINKRYSKALNYYQQVTDMKRRSVDYALYQTGRCHQRLEKYKNAVGSFTALANRYKKSEFRDDALLAAADIYVDFLTDWSNAALYAKELIDDYPKSQLVPSAYNIVGIAAANSKDKKRAIQNFKYVVLNYCSDQENALVALDNLSTLLNSGDYDRVYDQYREECPEGKSDALCDLDFRTGFDRFYADEYSTALPKFDSYLSACPEGSDKWEAYYMRGKCHENLENPDSALADYKRVYDAKTVNEWTVDALESAAEIQFNNGSHLASIQLFLSMEEAAEKMPQKVKAQFGRAKNYMAMGDYELASNVYMSVYTDPDATQYSRDRAHVQIANCKYHLNERDDAFKIYTEIEQKYENIFAAESQYMITKILYDQGNYEQSKTAGLYLKDNYPKYREWIAKVFLIVAEDYLELGDTFQCEGNLERLMMEKRFPKVAEAAKKRYEEIQAMKGREGGSIEPQDNDGKPEEEE